MKLDIVSLLMYLPTVIGIASIARLALNHVRPVFEIWIAPGSRFYVFYDKLERTVAYFAVAVAALGRKAQDAALVVQTTTVEKVVIPTGEPPRETVTREMTTKPLEGRE